jgi:hypothetical protein
MSFQSVVQKEIRHFLRKHPVVDGSKLEFEVIALDDGSKVLECQTWGYDYPQYIIPANRTELVRAKTMLQFGIPLDVPGNAVLGLYLDMMRGLDDAGM